MDSHQVNPLTDAKAKPSSQHQEFGSISKVRVIVRVRPFLPQEISSGNGKTISCVSLLSSGSSDCLSNQEITVHLQDHETSRNKCYNLDAFFGQEDKNVGQIFEREVKPLIPGIFQGYNATVFAYGATGSGKTYTMQGSDELPGLMPLAMSTILSICKNTGSTVEISFYEIYMDKCYDLLELKEKDITIVEDRDGQVHLKGLAQVRINSMPEFHEIFSCAIQKRKVAHTGLNDVSSRSHGVLVIAVSSPVHDSSGDVIIGKLNLIDLAGNEDNRRTGNEAIRLQESAKINKSLLALSTVIYALNNNKLRIPYRDSKLTRILQDSLGGTSRALMVACLNPGEYQESVHTVSLAARSRCISNFVWPAEKISTPKGKVDMEAKLLAWLESKGKTKSSQRMIVRGSPFIRNTPSSTSSKRILSTCLHSAEAKTDRNQGAQTINQRTPYVACRNLFNDGSHVDPAAEAHGVTKGKSGIQVTVDVSEENSHTILNDNKAKTASESQDCSGLVDQKFEEVQSPQRKALSPLNFNLGNLVLHDPKTPKSRCVLYTGENSQGMDTPLDKLNTRSSNLKNSLVQEYIEFLNTASRKELLEIKGIGHKMAEYITDLRETSPLKSLHDLEKIGLSSKQVHNMFGRAAQGLLG